MKGLRAYYSSFELRSARNEDAFFDTVTALPALDATRPAWTTGPDTTHSAAVEPFPLYDDHFLHVVSCHLPGRAPLLGSGSTSARCPPSGDGNSFPKWTYHVRFWQKRQLAFARHSASTSPGGLVMAAQMHPELGPQHRATMPPSPTTAERKPGFFKRHLAQRRQSSVSFGAASPASPAPAQSRSARPLSEYRPQTPQMVVRSPTFVSSPETPNVSSASPAPTPVSPNGLLTPQTDDAGDAKSFRGIKWAADPDQPPNRPRRTSSTGTGTRRSSIYSRAAAGGYVEGVDAGVGSKARRLSVHIPESLDVDECPLEEHFNFMQRHHHRDIGEGGAAVVKTMKSKTAGKGKDHVFAVKEFRARDPEEEERIDYDRKIKSEYAIAKSCQHPNIVESFCLCYSKDRWFHVMEYCELGDLNDLVQLRYFKPEDNNCMFKQLIRGIDYLHSRGIAHRDIKSENLLVQRNGCLKIADFGTGEVFSGTHPGLRNCRRQSLVDPHQPIRYCEPGQVGSTPYMAPEIFQRVGDYDPRAVDVWSAGIVFLSLWFYGTPWDSASRDCRNFKAVSDSWEEWLEAFPDGEIKKGRPIPRIALSPLFQGIGDMETKRLVLGMLHPDPNKRWTAKQALETTTVTDFACCQQEGYSDDIRTRQKKSLHNHAPPKDKAKHMKGH